MVVHVLPREFADVVSPAKWIPNCGGAVNDSAGYESVYDAIIEAEFVGLTLRSNVKAENLFFFFGETVKFLQYSFMRFCDSRSIPYNSANFYGPINSEQYRRCDKGKSDPMAVVLCKLAKSEEVEKRIASEQHQATDYGNGYQVAWCQFQEFKKVFSDGRHGHP